MVLFSIKSSHCMFSKPAVPKGMPFRKARLPPAGTLAVCSCIALLYSMLQAKRRRSGGLLFA
jgi:hypothetical protein